MSTRLAHGLRSDGAPKLRLDAPRNRCSIHLSYGGWPGESHACRQVFLGLFRFAACSARLAGPVEVARWGCYSGAAGEVAQEAGEGGGIVAEEAEAAVAGGAEQAAYLAGRVVVVNDERVVGGATAGAAAALVAPEAFVVGGGDAVAVREVAVPFVFGAVPRARRGFIAGVVVTEAIGSHGL